MVKKSFKIIIISLVIMLLFSKPIFAVMTYSELKTKQESILEKINNNTVTATDLEIMMLDMLIFLYNDNNEGKQVYSDWFDSNFSDSYLSNQSLVSKESASITDTEKNDLKNSILTFKKVLINTVKVLTPSSAEDYIRIYKLNKSRINDFDKETIEKAVEELEKVQRTGYIFMGMVSSRCISEIKNYYEDRLDDLSGAEKVTSLDYTELQEICASFWSGTVIDKNISGILKRFIDVRSCANILNNSSKYDSSTIETVKIKKNLYQITLVKDIAAQKVETLKKQFSKDDLQELKNYINSSDGTFMDKYYASSDRNKYNEAIVAFAARKQEALKVIEDIFALIAEDELKVQGDFSDYMSEYMKEGVDSHIELSSYGELTKKVGAVLSIIRNIGAIISVVCISIIGVKYMIGSAEERADYKKRLIPFAFGLVFFTGIIAIVSFIINFIGAYK